MTPEAAKSLPAIVNRKARHEYEILDSIEAGIVLTGTEVKSIRAGKGQVGGAFARVENGELWLYGAHIDEYSHGNRNNHDPERRRKLLAHAEEIRRLARKTEEKGLSLVVLRLYFKGARVKVELGVGRGKKLHDKREALAERQANRELDRDIKALRRGE